MAAGDPVVVVGGGPTGLAAAVELRRRGVAPVTVIEREVEPGGIPRHANHTGFGVRDLRRILSGPRYARRYVALAERAGVELVTETMVTGWDGGHRLTVSGPRGRDVIEPRAVVLATGCRERPRSARLVPGARPDGVMTTSTLQQLVYLHGRRVGSRAVIVGAEHVSFSAVATLAHGGASVTALVTELPRHQSLAAFRIGAAIRYRAPVWTRTAITRIDGEARVERVELTDLDSGRTRTVPCDLVIFTAGWVPDHELAAMAGCALDPGTRGPRADSGLRTTVPGVFAAGNVVHPAETADACGLGGRHVAATVAEHVSSGHRHWPAHVPMHASRPLRWVAPNLVARDDRTPLGNRVLLRSEEFLRLPRIEVGQDGRTLWGGRLARLGPGRSAHFPGGWTAKVDPEGGPVSVRVVSRRPR
jgi:thioredoxin reductase